MPNNTQIKHSLITNRILYLTNKRVMVLFLSFLVILPLFNMDYWVYNSNDYK